MDHWSTIQNSPSERLQYIALTSLWLESTDYPLLMSCADLGICLHTSSSGLDLPMKILDMFGSGIPVLAFYYPTLPELVKNGDNGIIFRSYSELAAHLFRLYCEGPYDSRTEEEMRRMRKNAYNIGMGITVPVADLCDCLSLSVCLSPSLCLSLSLCLLLSLSHCLSLCLSHSLSISISLTHTHTHEIGNRIGMLLWFR
jgi:hypothetical protein